MKRALITGITGQDGSYLSELLLSKGYEVHGIIRRVDYRDFLVIDPELYRPSEVRILKGDASKARKILKWCPQTPFRDLVVEMVDRDMELYSK